MKLPVLHRGLLVIAFCVPALANASLYTFSHIGVTDSGARGYPQGVNLSGYVALTVDDGSQTSYIRSPQGRMRKLSHIDGMQSTILDVNAVGVGVGVSHALEGDYRGDPRGSAATVWRGDQAAILPGLGGSREYAWAINDRGIIGGYSHTRTSPIGGVSRAVWWDDTGIHDLGTGGGRSAGVFGLNNRGTFVGSTRFDDGTEVGTTWQNGTTTHVGTPGGSRSLLNDVNEQGWASGDALLDGDEEAWRAVLWDGTALRNLGTLGGGWSSSTSIDDAGNVYGSATTAAGRQHAVMWSAGAIVDLNDVVVNAADLRGLTLDTAMGSDIHGNIYGILSDRTTGQGGAFMLTLVSAAEIPEPNTYQGLAAAFLAMLGGLKLGRRRFPWWRTSGKTVFASPPSGDLTVITGSGRGVSRFGAVWPTRQAAGAAWWPGSHFAGGALPPPRCHRPVAIN